MGADGRPLGGHVAGATCGAGRGIALDLGALGATTCITGRSTRGVPSLMHGPETIEETAQLVSRRGVGIAVRVDHTQQGDVVALFEHIEREQHDLDADRTVMARFGRVLTTWDLARECDLSDADGSEPAAGTCVREHGLKSPSR